MIIGTSGFTSIKALERSTKIIKKNCNKPVLITAPTSNVGLFLIYLLKNLDVNIEVVTSSFQNVAMLSKIKIKKIHLTENFIKDYKFPLLNEKYSVIFDNLGGDVLSKSLKYLCKDGMLVSIGNILGNYSKINLLPLILRGVKIIGLNAETSSQSDWSFFFKFLEKQKITNQLRKKTKIINLKELANLLNKKKISKSKPAKYLIKI